MKIEMDWQEASVSEREGIKNQNNAKGKDLMLALREEFILAIKKLCW